MSKLRWPFLPSRDLKISRTDGVYLYKDSGEAIIDAAGGAIVSNIGHGRQRVAEKMAEAAMETSYVVPPWITPSREQLLEELGTHWLPNHLTRMHATSGGTEANEAAVKIALHYQQAIGQTKRTEIISRSVSYHGTTLATASLSGHPGRKKGLESALPEFLTTPTPYPLRCPLGPHHDKAGSYYVEAFADLIENTGPENIAALIAEPITGSSGGCIVPPADYWPGIYALCQQHGILLIMDEVMTGFGRTGPKFGYQNWQIEPDILVGGKGLAGGYAPLGGVFAREEIGQAIQDAGFQVMFNTFGAHPVACAAAAQVLTIIREENLLEQGQQQGDYLHARLHEQFSQHPHVAEIRGQGLFAAIEVVKDRETLERYPQEDNVSNRLVADGLTNGVFFYAGGTGEVRDIVCMGPAFIITNEQIDQVVNTLASSLDRVTGS